MVEPASQVALAGLGGVGLTPPARLRHRKDKPTMEKESHRWPSHMDPKRARSGRTHGRSGYMRAAALGLKKATRVLSWYASEDALPFRFHCESCSRLVKGRRI